MSWQNIWRLAKSDYSKLIPILALAFYMASIPHLDYPYPVHIDEWVHLAFSKALLQAGSTTYVDPFFGQSAAGLTATLEAGFNLLWGVFHQISGISWLTIFRYFPGIIFVITVLSVYVLAQRRGFGWEAALFTSLIPTTVGILGPAFLVPVAMGLLFVALSLFIAFNFTTGWSYLVLFIFASFLLSIHAPSAIFLVIVLVPYILLNLKGNFKHSLGLTIALAIPFLGPFPLIFSMLAPTAKSLLSLTPLPTHIDFPRIINTYGYLTIGFSLLGTFLLAMRGGKRDYGLVLGLLALLLILVTFFTFHYGVSIMYQRGLMYMMLMVSIIAGAGLMGVKNLRLPAKISTRLKVPLITQNVGRILCLALIGITLAISIPARQDTRYYHMIDKHDYEAFVWIEENINESYERAILDPWKATAFTAITGKYAYARIHGFSTPRDDEANAFLKDGSTDTAFLRENGVSIVYTQNEVHNPDLKEVREYIYLLQKSEGQ